MPKVQIVSSGKLEMVIEETIPKLVCTFLEAGIIRASYDLRKDEFAKMIQKLQETGAARLKIDTTRALVIAFPEEDTNADVQVYIRLTDTAKTELSAMYAPSEVEKLYGMLAMPAEG